ncbi:MAG: RCC1 repeat-containing protein [Actinobacteria bacterium]|nr:RCC1 repeat-containing protein [Actinomycetota bacterium]
MERRMRPWIRRTAVPVMLVAGLLGGLLPPPAASGQAAQTATPTLVATATNLATPSASATVVGTASAAASATPTSSATAKPSATMLTSAGPTFTLTRTATATVTVAMSTAIAPTATVPVAANSQSAASVSSRDDAAVVGYPFTSLVAGGSHSCGLTVAGKAYCWGDNSAGQLGDGTTGTPRTTPAAVGVGMVFASLAAGAAHTCGLTSEGVAYCWGGNDSGQLGIGTSGTGLQDRSADKNVPTAVSGGISFRSLVAGAYHTCGLTSSWTTACWGLNESGQLLPHTSGNRNSPMEEVGLRFTRLVAGSSHTCGLEAGGAYCWGAHPAGSTPQLVVGAYSFANITSGASHACGLTASGTAYCWGNNASGQLGDGTTVGVTSPVAVSGGQVLSSSGQFFSTGGQFFSALSGGGSFTCGITTDGGYAIDVTVHTVTYCWGSNRYGQIGDGSPGDGTTSADRLAPVLIKRLFRSLATGGDHACGLNTTGVAYCWGRNDKGQLGDGTTINRSTPTTVNISAVPVVVPTPSVEKAAFSSLAAGGYHTCGLTSAGAAYCWGANSSGELGDGTTTNRASPVAVTGGKTFASIVAGTRHTCGLTSAGAAYCWGYNAYGQIGDGTAGGGDAQGNGSHTADRLSPVAVSGGKTFTSLAAGGSNTCGLTSAGVAYCWGNNYFGQIGDGTTGTALGDDSANRLAPTAVSGNLIFSGLAMGVFHTCGRTTVGKAYCWGQNSGGQIGDGTIGTNRLSPVAVSGNQSFSSLVVGYKDTCGVTAPGGAFCWGENNFGQIGDGTGGLGYSDHSSDRSSPVGVSGSQTFARLAAGESYACGVTTGSAAYCWGGNAFGQIGDGSMTGRVTPAAVAGSKQFTTLTTGWYHTCGLTTAGIAYCWGANGVGQIGDGAVATSEYDHAVDRLVPTAVDVSAVVVPTLSDEIATPLQYGWNLVALQVTPASPVTAMALCASLDATQLHA